MLFTVVSVLLNRPVVRRNPFLEKPYRSGHLIHPSLSGVVALRACTASDNVRTTLYWRRLTDRLSISLPEQETSRSRGNPLITIPALQRVTIALPDSRVFVLLYAKEATEIITLWQLVQFMHDNDEPAWSKDVNDVWRASVLDVHTT